MMRKVGLPLALLLLLATDVQASQSLELKLQAHFSYRDDAYSCSTFRSGVDFHAFGKIEKGKLTAFSVSNHPREAVFKSIYREYLFPPAEIPSLEEVDGVWWLSELQTSEAFLRWFFTHANNRSFCNLPKITKLKNGRSSVPFELEGVREGVHVSYSELLEVSGEATGTRVFESKIRFVQRMPSTRGVLTQSRKEGER